jgi:hypothetical protein
MPTRAGEGDNRASMRHNPGRNHHMLQWNAKLVFVVVVLVALAAFLGTASCEFFNFTW